MVPTNLQQPQQQQQHMATSTTQLTNDHDVGLEDVVNAIVSGEHPDHKNDDAATSAMIGKFVWMN